MKIILIALTSDNCVRNFIDSGAFVMLQKHYEVHFLVMPSVTKPIDLLRQHRLDYDEMPRSRGRWRMFYISMARYAKRCITFPIKYIETYYLKLNWFHRLASSLLALPGFAECFTMLKEFQLGTVKQIDEVITKVSPDLVIIPCAFNDSYSLDTLKSAKALGKKTLLIMFNWDNVSSKGVLPFLPDYMAVWGEQTKEHAIRIQRMPDDRVIILGAPQFERYHMPVTPSRDEWRLANGLPLNKKIILFTGMSRMISEIDLLVELDKAIENKVLSDVHVLYRPHPWKAIYAKEKSFFDYDFKHVTLDVQIKDHYLRMFNDKEYRLNKKGMFVPDYDYYPALFNAVDAVISTGTTMGIEAMIMGKPVLVSAFGDDQEAGNPDWKILTYEHHLCWPMMSSVIHCHRRESLVDDCIKLIAMAYMPEIYRKLQREVRYVVDHNHQTYDKRLYEAVNNLFGGGSVSLLSGRDQYVGKWGDNRT